MSLMARGNTAKLFRCKGICPQYRPVILAYDTRDEKDDKRCLVCDEWLEVEGRRCPCCGTQLRIRPVRTLVRRELMQRARSKAQGVGRSDMITPADKEYVIELIKADKIMNTRQLILEYYRG
jgi:hypothetical protein